MREFIPALVTGLVMALIGCVLFSVQTIRHMRQQRKWEQIAEDNYLLGKDEAADLLRQTCDKIAEDRELLAGYSERALLTQILLTLDGQSRRMDRMDDKLKCISHYKTYLADVNGKSQKLAQGFTVLDQELQAASAAMDQLQQNVELTKSRLEALVDALSGMGKLHQSVSSYASQLSNIELTLEYLQEKTAAIVADMDSVMSTFEQSPAKRLKTVEMEITGLSLLVNSLHDSVAELSAATAQNSSQMLTQMDALTAAVRENNIEANSQ